MVEQAIAQNIPEEGRLDYIRNNCDGVEVFGYSRSFTYEELISMKDQLSEISITLDEIEQQKKQVTDRFKEMSKEPKATLGALLDKIRTKSEFVKEQCYLYRDDEAHQIAYYNSEGILVHNRPMRPDEMQKTIQFRQTAQLK